MNRFTRRRSVFLYLPLLCQLASMFNTVLSRFGISHFYLFIYAISFGALLFYKNDNRKNTITLPALYIFLLLAIMFVHLINTQSISMILMGTMTYILPVAYWLLYYIKGIYYVDSIFKSLKIPYAIVAVLAFVQYFISPDLFGLYVADAGQKLWASNSDFSTYAAYFRATSVFQSAQALGLSMALYCAVFLKYVFNKKKPIDYICVVLYLTSGGLSGSKSFFLVITIFIIYMIFTSNSKKSVKFSYAVVIIAGIVALYFYQNTFGFIDRILNVARIADEEQVGRLSTYAYYIGESSLFGAGPGCIQNITGVTKEVVVAESYFLQMLYELGYIPFLIFLIMIIDRFYRSNHKIIYFLIAISMVYVHIFSSFTFFIFWSFILLKNFMPEKVWKSRACLPPDGKRLFQKVH